MKSIFKFVVVVAAGVLLWGGGNARGETLEEAIRFVLQTNPDIRAVAYNRLARDQEVIQAKGGYLPTLDSSITYGKEIIKDATPQLPDPSTTEPKSTVLSLRQNVFHFGTTQSEVRRQEARVQARPRGLCLSTRGGLYFHHQPGNQHQRRNSRYLLYF